jgi:predicted GNAT family acetyltransferase
MIPRSMNGAAACSFTLVRPQFTVDRPATISDFYNEARSYLLANETEHGLMLSVAAGTLVAPADAYWAVVRDRAGKVVAAALRTIPKMILGREASTGAAEALGADARQAKFESIIGPWASLRSFAAAFGGDWREGHHHVVYECRVAQSVPMPRGRARVVVPDDRSRIADWIQAFSAEAIGDGATRQAAEALADRHAREGSMWLWCVGEEPVACTAAVGRTPHGIRITSVYTPPEHRRHGYASALVASLTRKLLDGGRDFVFLYADRKNPTANAIYQRIGYREIAEAGELWRSTD